MDELVEEHTAEGGILADYLNDKDAVDAKAVNAKIKELKKTDLKSEELAILCEYTDLSTKVKEYTKLVKDLNAALDEACKAKYAELTIDEIRELCTIPFGELAQKLHEEFNRCFDIKKKSKRATSRRKSTST